MGVNFWISQVVGIFTSACGVVSMQLKNIKAVLLVQLATNALVAITNILLGQFGGAWVCVVGAAHSLVNMLIRRQGKELPKFLLPLFACLYVGASILGWSGWTTALPMVAALCFCLAINSSDPSLYRRFSMANCALWMVYDFLIGAYTTVICHGFILISAIIGEVRFLKAKKNETPAEEKQA